VAQSALPYLNLSYRHPGAGRDPVALRSVITGANKTLLYRDNRKPTSLDPGLRRDDE
jgi:hypothetical protein